MSSPDVVVIGAGIVGAACALAAARAGLAVTVLDRGTIFGGASSGGEGNLLVSDKPAGPELALAQHSLAHWDEVSEHLAEVTGLPGGGIELERKGGLMIAAGAATLTRLEEIAAGQRGMGIEASTVSAEGLRELEPHLARGLAGGMLYPQDGQLQPMLATATLLAAARRLGAVVRTHVEVTGFLRRGSRVVGVELSGGARIECAHVVNAAGAWAQPLAALAGVNVPVLPRRGVVLVTQPLPPLIRRKVYAAEYLSTVASDAPRPGRHRPRTPPRPRPRPHQTGGQRHQERAGACHHDPPPGQHPVFLQQRLGTTGAEHARQVPAGERQHPVVRPGGHDHGGRRERDRSLAGAVGPLRAAVEGVDHHPAGHCGHVEPPHAVPGPVTQQADGRRTADRHLEGVPGLHAVMMGAETVRAMTPVLAAQARLGVQEHHFGAVGRGSSCGGHPRRATADDHHVGRDLFEGNLFRGGIDCGGKGCAGLRYDRHARRGRSDAGPLVTDPVDHDQAVVTDPDAAEHPAGRAGDPGGAQHMVARGPQRCTDALARFEGNPPTVEIEPPRAHAAPSKRSGRTDARSALGGAPVRISATS